MTDIHLHNTEKSYSNVDVSILDWTPKGGGVLMTIAWDQKDPNQSIDIFFSISDALWLLARIPEAIEVRLLDGEYEAKLDRRPQIHVESPSGLGTFHREWHGDQEHACHCEPSTVTPNDQRLIHQQSGEPTSGLRHFLDE